MLNLKSTLFGEFLSPLLFCSLFSEGAFCDFRFSLSLDAFRDFVGEYILLAALDCFMVREGAQAARLVHLWATFCFDRFEIREC